MNAVTQRARLVAVASPLGEDALLFRRMVADERLARPFHYRLEVFSRDPQLDFDRLLGENLTVRLELPERPGARYFNGFVSAVAQGADVGRFATYVLTLKPWLWFLSRNADCRIFQNMTVPEIVKRVFLDHGVADFKDRLGKVEYPRREYCVQYRESDFAFVSRLLEEEGIYYYFRHENGKHTLVLANGQDSHEAVAGYQRIPYYPPNADGRRVRDHIDGWSLRRSVESGGAALDDYDFKLPRKNLHSLTRLAGDHAQAHYETFDYPGGYYERDHGEHYSRLRAEEHRTRAEIVHGRGNAYGLTVGALFTLENCPREDQNREYLMLAARHELRSDDYETKSADDGGPLHSCSFSVLHAERVFRPPRSTAKPVVRGPQTAVVVGRAGEEIHTDEYGRVKLQFHWDRYGPADQDSSCWVRVAQTAAGKGWGAVNLPRVGQEVVVDFLEGDPDRPLVTGRVYNGISKPPYALPENATVSTFKSNSSKDSRGFNELRFEDRAGREQLFMHAQRRMDLRVRGSLYETVGGSREVRVGWEKDGERGGDLNTLVRRDINHHVEQGEYRLVDRGMHQTVVEDVIESHQQNHTVLVGDTAALNAREVIIEGAEQLSNRSGKVSVEGTQTVHVKGGQLNIEAIEGMSLKVGDSFIVLDRTGVHIDGALVAIACGGAPQPAEAANSVSEVEIEEPFDAARADTALPGAKRGVRGTPRSRHKIKLKPQKVPPYRPVPEPPPPPILPPPEAESDKPCGLKDFKVRDPEGQKVRLPGPGKRLQIVPKPTTILKRAIEVGPVTLEVAQKYGGDDQVEAEVIVERPKDMATALRRQVGPPADPEWNSGGKKTYTLAPPNEEDYWTPDYQPERHYLHGKGCDEVSRMVYLELFPSDEYEAKLNLKVFRRWVKRINKGIEKFHRTFFSKLPVKFKPEIDPPAGELAIKWGWAEEDDWRAYYLINVSAGLKPVVGINLPFKISAMEIGGTAGLSAIGVPPPIAKVIAEYAAEYLADIFFQLKLNFKFELAGEGEKKIYHAGGESGSIAIKPALPGELEVNLTGKAGHEYVVYIELSGRAKTGLIGEGGIKYENKKLIAEVGIKWPGITLGIRVVIKTAKIFTPVDKEGTWTPFGEYELLKDSFTIIE